MIKTITLQLDETALKIIDEASKKEYCSRTSFLVRSSVQNAKKILEHN